MRLRLSNYCRSLGRFPGKGSARLAGNIALAFGLPILFPRLADILPVIPDAVDAGLQQYSGSMRLTR